jgi:hypothetical protein
LGRRNVPLGAGPDIDIAGVVDSLPAAIETLSPSEFVCEAVTNEPLLSGQQLASPAGIGLSGKATCSMPASPSEGEAVCASALFFDERCTLQQACAPAEPVTPLKPFFGDSAASGSVLDAAARA